MHPKATSKRSDDYLVPGLVRHETAWYEKQRHKPWLPFKGVTFVASLLLLGRVTSPELHACSIAVLVCFVFFSCNMTPTTKILAALCQP